MQTGQNYYYYYHTTTPQPFYGPFSGTTRVSRCQKRTAGLYSARGDISTIPLGATPSGLTSAHLHHPPIFSTTTTTTTFGFLANVHVRYMLLPVRLSSVCNVRAPYSGGSNFRQYFYGIRYLGHPLTSTENFMEIVLGEPLHRGS